MAVSLIADSGFLVAFLSERDTHGAWALSQAASHLPPWRTCEAVFAEASYLLSAEGVRALWTLARRGAVVVDFSFADNAEPVLGLLRKYEDVPMSFADACLVRMSELAAEPLILTTDSDFSIYRRHGRKVIPSVTPG